ncbi:phosphatase PAP2 family protein [Neolewinella persica]|uniref:phosphatase PAP2 family protein n=1 Tax=Neolewinella persica TaxID=70998 RepID=UPI00035CE8D8|nr:phosphatase PAP2 family protein [Neolewinella persica]
MKKRIIALFRRDERLLLHIITAIIVGFAALSILVFVFTSQGFDVRMSTRVQRYQSEWLDQLMWIISWFATIPGGLITVGTSCLTFLILRKRREALFLVMSLGAIPIISLIKRLFDRTRPTADLVRVIREFQNASFPSGHVTFYVVFFGFLALLVYRNKHWPVWVRRLVGGLSIFLIITIPFSRMYLGAHWFTDVVGGFLLGLLLLIGLVSWYSRGKKGARPQVQGKVE